MTRSESRVPSNARTKFSYASSIVRASDTAAKSIGDFVSWPVPPHVGEEAEAGLNTDADFWCWVVSDADPGFALVGVLLPWAFAIRDLGRLVGSKEPLSAGDSVTPGMSRSSGRGGPPAPLEAPSSLLDIPKCHIIRREVSKWAMQPRFLNRASASCITVGLG